ncbi:MAG: PAS domain S-box protein, partial [Actinomycetota bacterium]
MDRKEMLEDLFGEFPYKKLVREIKDFAILHLDAQGLIRSWNKGGEEIFGYREDEILGKSGEIIFTSEDRFQKIPESELELAQSNGRATVVRRHVRKDGSRFFAHSVTTTLTDETGNLRGYAKIVRDETERKQAEDMLLERSGLEALNGDIGRALVQVDGQENLLNQCAEILVRHLDVAFARIWTFNEVENILELRASAGIYTHLDGAHARVPIGKYKIGLIAEERLPHLTNDILNDPRLSDKEWAKREGMVAFAGYPLIVEDRLVGVMGVFSRHPLTAATLEAMASVSNGIASGIERKRIEDALRQSEEQYRIVAETASDAIISIDEKSTILFINRAATRIFGYAIEQMLGQNLTMLMPEYLREVHKVGQQRYLKTGKKHLQWENVEVPGLHRDG